MLRSFATSARVLEVPALATSSLTMISSRHMQHRCKVKPNNSPVSLRYPKQQIGGTTWASDGWDYSFLPCQTQVRSGSSEKVQLVCSHLAIFNPKNEAMYAATVTTVQQNIREANGNHEMVADPPNSSLQETLEKNVAYGTIDCEKHPDATVPHASQ